MAKYLYRVTCTRVTDYDAPRAPTRTTDHHDKMAALAIVNAYAFALGDNEDVQAVATWRSELATKHMRKSCTALSYQPRTRAWSIEIRIYHLTKRD